MMFIESNLNNNNISNNNHHANLAMVKYSPKTNTGKKGKYCSMCKKTTHNTSECRKNKKSNKSNHSANVIFSDNNIDLNDNIGEIAQCYNNDTIVDYRGNIIGETDEILSEYIKLNESLSNKSFINTTENEVRREIAILQTNYPTLCNPDQFCGMMSSNEVIRYLPHPQPSELVIARYKAVGQCLQMWYSRDSRRLSYLYPIISGPLIRHIHSDKSIPIRQNYSSNNSNIHQHYMLELFFKENFGNYHIYNHRYYNGNRIIKLLSQEYIRVKITAERRDKCYNSDLDLCRVGNYSDLNLSDYILILGFGFVYKKHLKYLECFYPYPLTEHELSLVPNIILLHRYITLSFRTYTLAVNALFENIQLSPVAFKRIGTKCERSTTVVWITKGWKLPVTRPELTIEDMNFRAIHGYKINNLNISNPISKFSALTIKSLDSRRTSYEARKHQIMKESRRLSNKERRELNDIEDYTDQVENLNLNRNLMFTEDDLQSEPDENYVMIPWYNGQPIDCDKFSDITDYVTVIKTSKGPDLIFDLQDNINNVDNIDNLNDNETIADVNTVTSEIDDRYDYNSSSNNHYIPSYNMNIHNTKIIGFRDNNLLY